MVEFINNDRSRIDDCDPFPNFFECSLDNNFKFRINRVLFVYKRTLREQLLNDPRVEVKFCLRDDEETDESKEAENWEIIVFPAKRKGREIPHATMVSHFDSCVNGNITVEKGKVTDMSSNHVLPGYEEIQDKVTEFAKLCVECLMN